MPYALRQPQLRCGWWQCDDAPVDHPRIQCRWLALVGASILVGVGSISAGTTSALANPVPACAAAGTCHFQRITPPKALVHDGPDNTHEVMIEYDIYVPDVATASTPQPGIIHFNGLAGSKDDPAAVLTSSLMASHGYVVLAYTSQGNGGSSGHLELDSPDYDVKDAMQMLDILAARSDVLKISGAAQVGTTGGSYGGAIQETLAEFDSRVKVISPWRTFNSAEYTLSPNNLGLAFDLLSRPVGVLKHGSAVPGWLDLIFVQGFSLPFRGGGGPPGTCGGWDPTVCSLYQDSVTAGRATPAGIAFIRKLSPASYIDKLQVPTMLVQGEHDSLFNLNEAIATYFALKARGVPVEMIWQFGAHGYDGPKSGGGTNEGDLQGDLTAQGIPSPLTSQVISDYGAKYLPRRLLAWMDHYLRGTAVDTGHGFSYYRDWIQYDHQTFAGPAFGDAPTFPAQESETLTLSGASDLVPAGQRPQAGTVSLLNPPDATPASYTEAPNFQAEDAKDPTGSAPSPFSNLPPSDPPGQVANFTSTPFAHDTESVGAPTAHIHLRSGAGQPDVVLLGKVFDVDPAGNAVMLPRAPAPVRIPMPADGAVDIKLLPFAHMFPAGHRVRLALATTDQAMGGNRVADQITLSQGGTDPATFSLPAASGRGPIFRPTVERSLPNSSSAPSPGLTGGFLIVPFFMIVAALSAMARRAVRRAVS